MKKFFLLILLLFSACHGRAEKLRIVSLSPSLTETVCFLGKGDFLCGRSTACDYPEFVKSLPAAGTFSGIFAEKLLLLRPTLVIAGGLDPASRKLLPLLKVNYHEIPVRNMEEYASSLRELGKLLGCPEKGYAASAEVLAKLKSFRLASAKEGCSGVRPKVLWVIWNSPLMVAGPGSFPDSLLKLAGAENAAEGCGAEYFKCSAEWILLHRPDFVVWTVRGTELPSGEEWKDFPRGRMVSGIDPDLLLRPGPRAFEGILRLKEAFSSFPSGEK